MKVSPAALIDHARSDEGRKQLRYAGVSVVFVPVGLICVQVLGAILGNYTAAQVLTSTVLTVPNFLANKHFVWRDTSKDNVRTQVAVFWVAAVLGTLFATGFTFVVESLFKPDPLPDGTDPEISITIRLLVVGAQLAGFGIVWVVRYLVLDKWIFKMTHHGENPTPEEEDVLHRDFPV